MAISVLIDEGLVTLDIREPIPEDRSYVATSMLREIYAASEFRGRQQTALGDHLMDRWEGSAPFRAVACLPSDPGLIIAFIMGDPSIPMLDYLTVRPSFRGNGIGRAMMESCLGVGHGVPCGVGFLTNDLTRDRATNKFPVGLLNNKHWMLTAV